MQDENRWLTILIGVFLAIIAIAKIEVLILISAGLAFVGLGITYYVATRWPIHLIKKTRDATEALKHVMRKSKTVRQFFSFLLVLLVAYLGSKCVEDMREVEK